MGREAGPGNGRRGEKGRARDVNVGHVGLGRQAPGSCRGRKASYGNVIMVAREKQNMTRGGENREEGEVKLNRALENSVISEGHKAYGNKRVS